MQYYDVITICISLWVTNPTSRTAVNIQIIILAYLRVKHNPVSMKFCQLNRIVSLMTKNCKKTSSAQSKRNFLSVGRTYGDWKSRLSANKVEATELVLAGIRLTCYNSHVYWDVDAFTACFRNLLLHNFDVHWHDHSFALVLSGRITSLFMGRRSGRVQILHKFGGSFRVTNDRSNVINFCYISRSQYDGRNLENSYINTIQWKIVQFLWNFECNTWLGSTVTKLMWPVSVFKIVKFTMTFICHTEKYIFKEILIIHCVQKKHPLTFSFISPRIICGFKQKLQWIYPRIDRFWKFKNRCCNRNRLQSMT